MDKPLWSPSESQIRACNVTQFAGLVEDKFAIDVGQYEDLHRWSIEHPEIFWELIWDYCEVIGDKGNPPFLTDVGKMPGACFFPKARLNFAENLLRYRDERVAFEFSGEDKVRRSLTYAEVYAKVSVYAQALIRAGVGEGDRVAAYMPNMPETVIAMLACASLGAIWSSCSPDFGVRGVVDRFGQIEPKVLFCVDGYFYDGKTFEMSHRVAEILAEIESIEYAVVVNYADTTFTKADPRVVEISEFTQQLTAADINFERRGFNHPLYIMYSSGTTGAPKCIVHGAGGTLLQHLKEHRLHTDLKVDDRLMYFTTCGWMMWNWLVTGLASGATLLLYDGSPFYPNGNVLFDFADEVGMTIFGTSAKFIDAVKKAGLRPIDSHNLSSLRSILSTGSPLSPESFEFVYDAIKKDVCLSSITGGTDLISCFALGNPALPVWSGEIQCKGLGMAVDVFDDDGHSLSEGKGELVCTVPFPSMPIGFWSDPDGAKYRSAYFERYENVWHHGDYVALTEHGGLVMFGRSDAVLNPGGVRIGTAEIYRQVEQLDEIVEGLVIGQQWADDVRVILFVKLRTGLSLTDALVDKVKRQVREHATPRHVPAKVIQVKDIPRTKSGKIVELAVRAIVHGEMVKNREALANPEALAYFADRPELSN